MNHTFNHVQRFCGFVLLAILSSSLYAQDPVECDLSSLTPIYSGDCSQDASVPGSSMACLKTALNNSNYTQIKGKSVFFSPSWISTQLSSMGADQDKMRIYFAMDGETPGLVIQGLDEDCEEIVTDIWWIAAVDTIADELEDCPCNSAITALNTTPTSITSDQASTRIKAFFPYMHPTEGRYGIRSWTYNVFELDEINDRLSDGATMCSVRGEFGVVTEDGMQQLDMIWHFYSCKNGEGEVSTFQSENVDWATPCPVNCIGGRITGSEGLAFTGAQHIEIPDNSVFHVNDDDDFTIEANVYLQSTKRHFIFSHMTKTRPSTGFQIFIGGATGPVSGAENQLRMEFGHDTGTAYPHRRTSGYTIPLNTWTHVAVAVGHSSAGTRDSLSWFVNGDLVGAIKDAELATDLENHNEFFIGGERDELTAWAAHANLVEVRFWNTMRSEQQIQDNMNWPMPATTAGLVGQWLWNPTANSNGTTCDNRSGGTTGVGDGTLGATQ